MGCKYSKVIPRGKQGGRVRSAKRPREESKRLVMAVDASTREPSTEEKLDDLYAKGFIKNPKKSGGGIAFDIGHTDLPPKPPRRWEEIKKPKEGELMYTSEEKALMVEILREGNARENGLKRDLKQDKAKRKRMFKEAETKARVENKRKRYDQRMEEMDKNFLEKMSEEDGTDTSQK